MTTTVEPPKEKTEAAPPPRAPRPARARPRKDLLIGVGALGVLVVAAIVYALIGALSGPEQPTAVAGPANAPFRVNVPNSWRTFTQAELSALPGDPVAVMRRKDGKGFLVVRQEGKSPKSFESFTSELDRELERKLPDFQKRTGRTLQIKAGPAFFYSYIRKRGGTVHTVVVVPAGNRSYALNTVAQGGEDDVAKEIGRMIVSFDT